MDMSKTAQIMSMRADPSSRGLQRDAATDDVKENGGGRFMSWFAG
jgi:hypothetical protein